jgi:hypothetical protein
VWGSDRRSVLTPAKATRFHWADVAKVGPGPGNNIAGLTSSVGFVLNDGRFIKCDGANSYSNQRTRSMVSHVLESASPDVYQRSIRELNRLSGKT